MRVTFPTVSVADDMRADIGAFKSTGELLPYLSKEESHTPNLVSRPVDDAGVMRVPAQAHLF